MAVRATLKAICDACKQPVSDGDGHLYVDMRDVNTVEQAWDDYEREKAKKPGRLDRGRELVLESAADIWEGLFRLPQPARWHVHHIACDPTLHDACYSIEVKRVRTWPALADWTAHLMNKQWLRHTDWDKLLQNAARGGESRITPIRKPDPKEVL
jgi:hypothetical protein